MRFVNIGGLVAILALGLIPTVAARPSRPADEGLGQRPPGISAAGAEAVFAANPLRWDGVAAQADSVLASGAAPLAGPVQARADGLLGLDETYTWIIDNFDGFATLNPSLWVQNQDLNDIGETSHHGNIFWSTTRCRSKSAPQSMWPFGGGTDGAKMTCDMNYPNGVSASAIMLLQPKAMFAETPGSLRMLMDVLFNLRDHQENGVEADGLFVNLVIPPSSGNPAPKRITLLHRTGRFPEAFFNEPLEIDFINATNVYKPEETYNLLDMDTVFIEFLAITQRPTESNPNPTTYQGGMFIDNIRFESDMRPTLPEGTAIATVAATVRATDTPLPGVTPPTATMTDEPEPTTDTPTPTDDGAPDTPTATATRTRNTPSSSTPTGTDFFAFLPRLERNAP